MVICLYGASGTELDASYLEAVERFGESLARRGHTLLFGGGAQGLMGAAARGAKRGGGKIIGVAPTFFQKEGVLFPECDVFYPTETMRQRKQRMEELADAFVAVPGGIGTLDEWFEILTLKQLGRHEKPIALLNLRDFYRPMLEQLALAAEQGFLKESCRTLYHVFSEGEALLDALEREA